LKVSPERNPKLFETYLWTLTSLNKPKVMAKSIKYPIVPTTQNRNRCVPTSSPNCNAMLNTDCKDIHISQCYPMDKSELLIDKTKKISNTLLYFRLILSFTLSLSM
jgi:hypothetical protein